MMVGQLLWYLYNYYLLEGMVMTVGVLPLIGGLEVNK